MRHCGWHQDSDQRITGRERRRRTGMRSQAQMGIWTAAATSIGTCMPNVRYSVRMGEYSVGRDVVGRARDAFCGQMYYYFRGPFPFMTLYLFSYPPDN